MVLSNTSRECTCTCELTDVHQCIKVDFPCCCFVWLSITSFHSFSNAAFASGINIAWGERSFAHSFGFPRQSSLKDRSPALSEPFVTLGFPISIFCLCVHLPHLCVHPRFAEQNNIRSLYFFLPKFSLESISYSPSFSDTRRILSHRYAVSRDEHLKKSKIRCRKLSFRSFHWNEFVYQVVILHRIPFSPCKINISEFCFRHFGSYYFGTAVSRMHLREYGLLHGTAVSLFAYSCFLSSFRCFPTFLSMRQAIYDLDGMSSECSSICHRVCYTLSEEFRSTT